MRKWKFPLVKKFPCLALLFCFVVFHCAKPKEMQVVPGEFCLERTPRVGSNSKIQVIDSNLIFHSGETKTEYLLSEDKRGDYVYIVRSTDGGKTFTKINPPSSESFRKKYWITVELRTNFSDANRGFVYTNHEGASAFFTNNAGESYTSLPHGDSKLVQAVYINSNRILLFGANYLPDQLTNNRYPIIRMFYLDSNTVSNITLPGLDSYALNSAIYVKKFGSEIIVSYNHNLSTSSQNRQRFFRSVDSGTSFQEIVPLSERNGIISFYNTNLAYRIYNGDFSSSSDLGVSWNLVGQNPGTYPSTSGLPDFLSSQYLYLRDFQSTRTKYYRSDFPGNNWEEITISSELSFFENYFAKDTDSFYSIGRENHLVSWEYPYSSSIQLGKNPIQTHASDNRRVINRFELMALGYFCMVF